MPNAAIIDLDHLEKYVAGDDGLRDEILVIFSEQLETLISSFSAASSDDEWQFAAHSMKGASRGVGAWALGDLCEEAEGVVGNVPAKSERRATMLVSIRGQVDAALAEVKQLRS